MVEEVVSSCTDRELESFLDLKVLEDGEIGIKEVRSTYLISSLIAKSRRV